MSTLQLKSLRKQFAPDVIPVKDVNLTVEDGEFLTLLGPSGCGKSTLLRLIAGLEQPTAGEVRLGDQNLNRVAPGDRNMAMVFQSYALYPHMTVAENIATALKLRDVPKAEIQQRVGSVSEKLAITHLRDRKPSKLSGGQRQRVALARALVREPAVFLLDEPLSNLDALLREQVREDLKQLFEEQQKPVVYVTHDQTEAMTLSSKVAVLLDGVVQQLAEPSLIYTQPANRFVASFVGSPQMNLLTLKCEGDRAQLGPVGLPLPTGIGSPSTVIFGLRPEAIRLAQAGDSLKIPGQVFLVENFGREQLLSVRVENSDLKLRALIPPDQHWERDRLELTWTPEQSHWFDPQNEQRLETSSAAQPAHSSL
ncbi:MAG: ABC transporter ATP-binding protein [Spirulinaceae cyanobacterium SM2_1_0]|nr:ABC transporter ATP-binding protein [Spirulinaceae cyanobacterium SM2_1_0]